MNLDNLKLPSNNDIDFDDLDFSHGVIMIQFVQKAIEKLKSVESLVTNSVDLKTLNELQAKLY